MRAYLVLGICVSLGWSSHALAASLESRARAAQRACLTGDPGKGVEMLTDLYLDTQDPTYIFNQGRCFEMNRRYEDAIGRFREYLVKAKKITKAEKADTEKRIAECQSYLPKPEQKPEPTTPPPKPEPLPVAPPKTVSPPAAEPLPGDTAKPTPPPPIIVIQQRPAERPGSALRATGLVTGAVGIAALAAGVILNLKVNSMSNDLEKPYNYSPSTDASREDYKTAGWVGYGVGTACLAGGALLYYLGWGQGAAAAVEPTIAPGMAGATVKGSF